MPQIANQDYNFVGPQFASELQIDCAALSLLAGHIERGTIFDVLIDTYTNRGVSIGRVFGFDKKTNLLQYFDASGNAPDQILVNYSSKQYDGLAAVQFACGLPDDFPQLTENYGYLKEATSDEYICVDDYLISVVLDEEDNIISLSISGEETELSHANIPFDKVQELIGISTHN